MKTKGERRQGQTVDAVSGSREQPAEISRRWAPVSSAGGARTVSSLSWELEVAHSYRLPELGRSQREVRLPGVSVRGWQWVLGREGGSNPKR